MLLFSDLHRNAQERDFPLVTQRRALDEFEQAGLSPEQSRLVRGANAVQLLGL